jgi:hypothetical protein
LHDQRIDLCNTRLRDRELSPHLGAIVQRDGDANVLYSRLDRIEWIARQGRLDRRREDSCTAIEQCESEQQDSEGGNASQLTGARQRATAKELEPTGL